jgi:hypothetical protein
MKAEIEKAIQEIREAFGVQLEVEADENGGAFVRARDLFLGTQYEPERSWSAFRITFQYPFTDTYPHFFVACLQRKDGRPLGEGFHSNGQVWEHPGGREPATMVSRRSNKRDPSNETAALKLAKVLDWIRSQ